MRKHVGLRALLAVRSGLLVAIAALALATSATLALGCGSESPSDDPPAPAAKPAQAPAAKAPAPTPPEPTAAPQAAVSEGELPADYPDDLPVYPGSKTRTSLGIPGAAMLVTFDSQDPSADILAHLSKELEGQGWSVRSDGAKLEATKGERKASFRVNAATGGGSTIAVTVTRS